MRYAKLAAIYTVVVADTYRYLRALARRLARQALRGLPHSSQVRYGERLQVCDDYRVR